MDREFEEQLDQIFSKALTDLKTKVGRLVIKHEKKLVREYTKELKNVKKTGGSRQVATKESAPKRQVAKKDRYNDESDSDSDYSS